MSIKIGLFFLSTLLLMTSCGDDEKATPSIEVPETYNFVRNGQTTVSFGGQTTRIEMGHELIAAMKDFSISEGMLLEMFANQTTDGGNANPFSNEDLNISTKNIRSKVAASADFFSANTVATADIKAQFESWILGQVNEVFPNQNILAEPGIAGQIADGTSTRYINAQGLEYNQLVNKSLIGALMTDQALNNYLGTAVLDAGDNRLNNDAGTVDTDKNYTSMEHKWDEAYGYIYGTSADVANPNETIGSDDSFLNKYIGRVEDDADFAGIAAEIFDAFKLGRAAIVAGNYEVRDEQAAIIREKISEIIGIRAVYYLQQSKKAIESNSLGTAFHDLSEGFGFLFSLQFTRKSDSIAPCFTKSEVETFWTDLLDDGANGLWDIQPATLDAVSSAIANQFDFTVAMAAE